MLKVAARPSPVGDLRRAFARLDGDLLIVALGLAALLLPTLQTLSSQYWSTDADGQGPILLATSAWLLWRQLPDMRRLAQPSKFWVSFAALIVALAVYVAGRAYGYMTIEVGGLYGVVLTVLYQRYGAKALIKTWFPLFYMALAIPIPASIRDSVTIPLKHFVSYVAANGLHALGYPVAREGVVIMVSQYQLLMEDACSGLNSLEGLIAIGLLYVYLVRGSSVLYSMILTVFVIPIAILANIIRVSILVLLTYYFGDQVAQSFIHFAAGMMLFATSLMLVFAVDALVQGLIARRRKALA
jgi:exosortase